MVQITRLPQPKRMWLPVHYAPKAGYFTVLSTIAGYRMGELTIVGHIVRYHGKLQRFWFH